MANFKKVCGLFFFDIENNYHPSEKYFNPLPLLSYMLKLKKVSQTYGMKVYTNDGDYFGIIEDAQILENRIYGWKIRPDKESILSKLISGAKGVIVPHKLVEAIGDIMIISRTAIPPVDKES